MVTILWILAYVASVFLSRWFNKMAVKVSGISVVMTVMWFVPLLNILALGIILIVELFTANAKSNWFTGKNW
jgi:hypothetical protein